MEIITSLIGSLSQYIYIEIVIGVFFLTEGLKKYIPRFHPKWIGLATALVVCTADYFIREDANGLVVFTSFLVTGFGYDYIYKPAKDFFKSKK